MKMISDLMGTSGDIVIRRISINTGSPSKPTAAAIIYIDGLADSKLVNEFVLRPLMTENSRLEAVTRNEGGLLDLIESGALTVGDVKRVRDAGAAVDGILSGDSVLLVEGSGEALILNTRGWEQRTIEEPSGEIVLRGPREGFLENMRVNTALLRRRIRDPALTVDITRLGRRSKTNIAIVYLKGIAPQELVGEVKRRLKAIDIDAILESGYVEEYIEDEPFSPFPTLGTSERPDVVAAKILEGRVAILVDGSPIVLTAPLFFVEGFQSPEDYYTRSIRSSLVRWIRYGAFLISILAPAIYVALTSFHHELLPTTLMISLAAAREGTPFPSVLEALGMGIIFEILREAGVRLPKAIGQAISIVGALVIGQAAIGAGLVGAPMVVVVALTAIASFVSPTKADEATILRGALTIMAGFLGAFGIMIGLLAVLVHLSALTSFGSPYLAPFAPLRVLELQDTAVRAPLWFMSRRPRITGKPGNWRRPSLKEDTLLPGETEENEYDRDR